MSANNWISYSQLGQKKVVLSIFVHGTKMQPFLNVRPILFRPLLQSVLHCFSHHIYSGDEGSVQTVYMGDLEGEVCAVKFWGGIEVRISIVLESQVNGKYARTPGCS